MDERGYFSTPRDIEDDPIFDNPKLFKVYMWCRMKAGHKDERYVMVGNQTVLLTKNQFIFGTFQAEEKLKMKKSTIWRYLRILEKRQKVGIKTTNKYSIITVKCDILNNPKWETNGKQMGTTNNVDNDLIIRDSLREEDKDKVRDSLSLDDIRREIKKVESILRSAKQEKEPNQFYIDAITSGIKQWKEKLKEKEAK